MDETDPGLPWRPRPRLRPRWISTPLFVLAVQVGITALAGHKNDQPERYSLDFLGYLLLSASPLILFARRRYPVATLAGVMTATSLYYALAYPYGPAFFALIVAIVGAVKSGHLREAVVICSTGYVVGYLILSNVFDRDPPTSLQALAIGAWLLVILIGAEVVRGRQEHFAETARAIREQRRRRQSEERLRIARELHDVLAHNISLINVQAGVALHLIDDQPEQARTALAAIKEASKEALDELRSVLSILRGERGENGGDDEAAPRAPAPTVERISELVDRSAAAGVPVQLEVHGTPRPLPPSVDLTAFRIVQEALTNVTRHAGLAHATVRLDYGDEDLTLTIEDDGHGARYPNVSDAIGTGSGIIGMRERAMSLGGTLDAGPRVGGGFRVAAVLPTSRGDITPDPADHKELNR